jgi:catechol 2,3-dioxygenase-like lactoylglutathione lyase family enzyme
MTPAAGAPRGAIVGLDHVQVGMPRGAEDAARRFYGELLGLEEVAKPAELAARGGCWFTGPGVALHLGIEDPFVPATRAHVAFVVADLAATRSALDQAGIAQTEDDSGLPVRRSYARDPFGNRVELVDARDAGFTAPARRAGA